MTGKKIKWAAAIAVVILVSVLAWSVIMKPGNYFGKPVAFKPDMFNPFSHKSQNFGGVVAHDKKEEVSLEIENDVALFDADVISPKKNETVKSPLAVKGRARGTWFFEGSFPVKILDSQKSVISESYVSAEGEWMTEDFVAFKGTIEFPGPKTKEGFLLLEKDNPSGLPELDESVFIPVKFAEGSGAAASESAADKNICGAYSPNEKILGDCGDDCNTDNWKEYKNKKYGYSFRYSPDFQVSEDCKNSNCIMEEQGGDRASLTGDLSERGWPMIDILHLGGPAYNPPKNSATGEWIKEKFPWLKDCLPATPNLYLIGKDGSLIGAYDIYVPASEQAYSRREIFYYLDGKIFEIIMLDVNSPQARQFYDVWLSAFHTEGE